MRKDLFLTAVLAGTVCVGTFAQSVKKTSNRVAQISTSSNVYFERPAGLFYSLPIITSEDSPMQFKRYAYAPANKDIVFESFDQDVNWVHPTSGATVQGASCTINLPKGEYSGVGVTKGSEEFKPFDKLIVGKATKGDHLASNSTPSDIFGQTQYSLATYYYVSNDAEANQHAAEFNGCTDFETCAFLESFNLTAKAKVDGFGAYFVAWNGEPSANNIDGDLYDSDYGYVSGASKVTVKKIGEYLYYAYLQFREPIEMNAGNLTVALSATDGELNISPVFFYQSNNENIDWWKSPTSMVWSNYTYKGERYENRWTTATVAFQDGVFRNWAMGLAMSYDLRAPIVTGIKDVVEENRSGAAIYNVMGVMVSANGETEGLPSGIYIQNGKKFILK